MNRCFTKAFLFTLALLCGCELIVRVFFARSMSGRFEYGYDHNASGFREQSDGTVKLVRSGGRKFHPQSFARAKPDGVFRIIVLGDSVARGPSLQQSYPYRVGEILRAQGIKAESFNLALPGFGATRNQIVLEQILKYQPSLVIFHLNNSNEFEDERDWRRAEAHRSWHPRNWPMKSLLLARLYEMKTERVMWKWLPAELRDQNATTDTDDEATATRDPENVRRWNQNVADKTAEDVALCRNAGVPLLLLTQARCQRQPDGSAVVVDPGLDEMIRPLLGEKVVSVSMTELLSRPDAGQIFSDSSHLHAEGHGLLARAIIEKLQREGLLPDK